ncbi:MAG TPA: exosortase/archaeosortase family protein [Phycisphaerae bacterium]
MQVSVLAVLFLAAFWNTLRYELAWRWSHDDTWTYCWLVPVFSLYFLAGRREALRAVPSRASVLGLLVLLAGIGLYTLGLQRTIGYFKGVAAVVTIAGLAWYLAGTGVMRIAWFPIAFLLLAIPLPYGVYVSLTQPLQMLAARAAALLLAVSVPGLSAEAAGVRVDYFYQGVPGSLHVDQGCSGMRTQMALLTLALVVAYQGQRPNWQRVVLVAACVPIAILVNVLRVTLTGWLQVHGLTDYARGSAHALLGIVLFFGVALSLLMLVGYVLQNLFIDDGPEHRH